MIYSFFLQCIYHILYPGLCDKKSYDLGPLMQQNSLCISFFLNDFASTKQFKPQSEQHRFLRISFFLSISLFGVFCKRCSGVGIGWVFRFFWLVNFLFLVSYRAPERAGMNGYVALI